LALFAALVVALAVCARLRARGLRQAAAPALDPRSAAAWLRFPGPKPVPVFASVAAFLVLGFGPIAQAGYASIIAKIRAFAAVPVAPVEQKGPLFYAALDEASRLLDRSLLFSRVGIAAAVVIAAFLTWKFSATRARARMLGTAEVGPAKGATGVVIACGATAIAVAAFVAARPLRQENGLPWPPYAGGERLLALITTADLDGPDELERAPVIYLTPDAMDLDGAAADAETLSARLDTLAGMYRRLRPDETYNGQSLIICQADTSSARLAVALRAAVEGGAPHTTIGFLRKQVTDRPLFGRRWRNVPTAARTTTIETKADAEDGATIVAVDRFPTCAALSKEIVAARRAGHAVALLLPATTSPGPGRR
jgi:hypothetical protein